MVVIADMHTHTISSGHGYSTVNEMALAAAERGLKVLAITDHGPALPGGPHLYHFGAMRFIPTRIHGVRILRGVEANIIDQDGAIDLPVSYQKRLDFVMAGFHEECGYRSRGVFGNTETVLRVMANPLVKAVSHPGNPEFPLDFEELARGASATGTALEINNSSFSISRKGSRSNCETLAELVARHGTPVVIGSDAHISQGVGIFDDALTVINRAGIDPGQVINTSLENLGKFLGMELAAEPQEG